MSEETKALNWDTPIDPTATQKEHILLPKGNAYFTVVSLKKERKQFGKFGIIPVAVVSLIVTSAENPDAGTLETSVQLGLHSDLAWKILDFFTGIGQRKHGDTGKFVPDWNKVVGSDGKCYVIVKSMTSKKGKSYEANEIDKFDWIEAKEETSEVKF